MNPIDEEVRSKLKYYCMYTHEDRYNFIIDLLRTKYISAETRRYLNNELNIAYEKMLNEQLNDLHNSMLIAELDSKFKSIEVKNTNIEKIKSELSVLCFDTSVPYDVTDHLLKLYHEWIKNTYNRLKK